MKSYTYLLLFNGETWSSEKVKRFLDSRQEIEYWFRCLPNSFFLVSSLSATELTKLIRRESRHRGRFLILDTDTDRNGWLPKPAWDLMKSPESAVKG